MSFADPNGFLTQIEQEMIVQNITEETIMMAFKEDFPQAYFMVFTPEDYIKRLSEIEEALTTMIWLAYATGYIRRGPS